ncbi:hypothetical protein Turpa_0706 [Turneriella parva DSM 21527]|uniref:Uncharacterized protein n=1 Tax=Turneriella parva (strain ATCC BAA-1111 / DSM 21527 / NCTC 11395 / H) TaxID=869212 RepID=I4B250_TURPD|nr:hypothetical protein Turpa_0706 [Turneriella parva DSM 21527]
MAFGADDNSAFWSLTLGQHGLDSLLARVAGLKPTSVMHDNLVVTRKMSLSKWEGFWSFFGSMPASAAIAQPVAHMSFRANNGYRNYHYGIR